MAKIIWISRKEVIHIKIINWFIHIIFSLSNVWEMKYCLNMPTRVSPHMSNESYRNETTKKSNTIVKIGNNITHSDSHKAFKRREKKKISTADCSLKWKVNTIITCFTLFSNWYCICVHIELMLTIWYVTENGASSIMFHIYSI